MRAEFSRPCHQVGLFKTSIEGDIRNHYSCLLFPHFPSCNRATYGSAECIGLFLCFTLQEKKEFILEWSNSPIFIFDCRTAVTRLPTLETGFVIKGTTKVTKTELCVRLVCNRVTAALNCCSPWQMSLSVHK